MLYRLRYHPGIGKTAFSSTALGLRIIEKEQSRDNIKNYIKNEKPFKTAADWIHFGEVLLEVWPTASDNHGRDILKPCPAWPSRSMGPVKQRLAWAEILAIKKKAASTLWGRDSTKTRLHWKSRSNANQLRLLDKFSKGKLHPIEFIQTLKEGFSFESHGILSEQH